MVKTERPFRPRMENRGARPHGASAGFADRVSLARGSPSPCQTARSSCLKSFVFKLWGEKDVLCILGILLIRVPPWTWIAPEINRILIDTP